MIFGYRMSRVFKVNRIPPSFGFIIFHYNLEGGGNLLNELSSRQNAKMQDTAQVFILNPSHRHNKKFLLRLIIYL